VRGKVRARSDLRASHYVYHTASIARDHEDEEDEGSTLLLPRRASNQRGHVCESPLSSLSFSSSPPPSLSLSLSLSLSGSVSVAAVARARRYIPA
jgi:hypothetical protein